MSEQDIRVHITRLNIIDGDVGERVNWLARLMMLGVASYDVLSAEIIPPASSKNEWSLVQRFNTAADVDRWKTSEPRRLLLGELDKDLAAGSVELSEAVEQSFGTVGTVAVAIVTKVKPGREAEYCECEGKYQSAQARLNGYRGVYLQPPTSGRPGVWTTLIRFDSPDALDAWFNSEERKKLLEESDMVVTSTDYQRVSTSFPGWFPQAKDGGSGPPNWKAFMLVLLGLYPIVMLEIRYLMPHLSMFNPALAGFIGNVISVAGTTWLTMPPSIKLFDQWLFPPAGQAKWVQPGVILILCVLYALEILFFGSVLK